MKKLIFLPFFFVAIQIMLASCKKDFELSDSPNSSTEVKLSAEQLLNEEVLTRSLDSSIRMAKDSIEGLYIFKKSPIPFVPFKMVDRAGRSIEPNKVLTLESGGEITANAYFDRLNSIEKWMNGNGCSLFNNLPLVASETVTEKEYLDETFERQLQSNDVLLTEEEENNVMKPYNKLDNLVLKPMDEYSPDEKKTIDGYVFKSSGDDQLNAIKRSATIPNVALARNSSILKEIDVTNKSDWTRGKAATLKATLSAEINRKATVYQFDPQNPNANLSDFKVTGKGNIEGTIFGQNFNLLGGVASFNAPASAEKKMSAKVKLRIGGISVLNLSKSYQSTVIINKDKSMQINKSVRINVPIFWGVSFVGKIGVAGRAGFKYGATLKTGYVNAHVTPYSSLKGNIEAGASILGILGGGVGGDLTFIDCKLPMRGSMYVTVQNATQIVLRSSRYFGYNLALLKGRLYYYAEACIPWIHCWRVEHNFFSWKGYEKKGTLSSGSSSYIIPNL